MSTLVGQAVPPGMPALQVIPHSPLNKAGPPEINCLPDE